MDAAVNCTVDPATQPMRQRLLLQSDTERLCAEPICMDALKHLYEASISSQDWITAAGVFLTPTGAYTATADTATAKTAMLTSPVVDLEKAVEAGILKCLGSAGVSEASLGLPNGWTIARLTSRNKFLDMKSSKRTECTPMRNWMNARLAYFVGYNFAQAKLAEGTACGLIIAIAIGSFNVCFICGLFVGIVVCLRRRSCYMCMKDVCPRSVDAIVACGWGPTDAEHLNNEVVMGADAELQTVRSV